MLKIGKKKINPKRAQDKKGTSGVFLTEREWNTILIELKIKIPPPKKQNILEGTVTALKEVEWHLRGKKKLRNANAAVSEL